MHFFASVVASAMMKPSRVGERCDVEGVGNGGALCSDSYKLLRGF